MSEYTKVCALCTHGKPIPVIGDVLCPWEGVVGAEFVCKRFCLDYLRLDPKRPRRPQKSFTFEDFSIE